MPPKRSVTKRDATKRRNRRIRCGATLDDLASTMGAHLRKEWGDGSYPDPNRSTVLRYETSVFIRIPPHQIEAWDAALNALEARAKAS